MKPERWQQIKGLLADAADLPTGERAAFLDNACGPDTELRAELEVLLKAHDEAEEADLFASPVRRDPVTPVEQVHVSDERIGSYRLIRELGRGGMGTVYLAERADETFTKQVALKRLRGDIHTPDLLARFLYEREILAALDHLNIARLFDGGTDHYGRPYLVMEYVEGQPITDYCASHRLSTEQRLELFRTVCRAVQFAHQNLVVHRDLKPSNILVTEDGTVKLLDFGIAKLLDEDSLQRTAPVTRTGFRLLTPEYASPEQVRGEAVTTASDVYQLGVLLYELLAGRRPYQISTRTEREIEQTVLEEEPRRPSVVALNTEARPRLKRELEGDLDNIVLKALRKEVERRYASAEGLSEDLRRHLAGLPVEARADTLGYRMGKFVRRHRNGVLTAAVVLLLFIGGGTFYTLQVTQARNRAEAEAAKAEQINTFLQQMLASANAEEGSRDVTVLEVVNQAADRIDTAFSMEPELKAELNHTLGQTYQSLGRFEEADRHLEEALALQTRHLGEMNEATVTVLNDYALLRQAQGDYAEAEPLFREALERRVAIFGRSHINTAISLNNLGYNLDDQGRYAEAESLYQAALTTARAWPEEETFIGQVLNNLATLRHALGHYEAAAQSYREALALHAEDEVQRARIYNNLGALFYAQQRFDSAAVHYRRALAIRRDRLGEAHPTTLLTLHNLGNLLRAQGKLDEAEPMLRQTLDLRRTALGPKHSGVAYTLMALALLELQLERPDQAVAAALEARSIFAEAFSPDHWLVGYAEGVHGRALVDLNRFAEAEPTLHRSYEKMESGLGPDHDRTRTVRSYLDELYELWDQE